MADIPNILPYVGKLDFVSPLDAALHLRESRENEKTQRMFAQNTMERQSAEEYRSQRDFDVKEAERKRQHGIEAAQAIGQAQQMARTPGGIGPAQALLEAYGGHLNPLTAAVAGPPPPPGDPVDQALAQAGAPAGPPPMGAPAMGPPTAPAAPAAALPPPDVAADRSGPGGVTLEGPQQQQSSVEGNFMLPTAFHVSPGMQAAMDHKGFVPPGSAMVPRATPPAGPDAELERLMQGATPPPRAAEPPPAPPTNPLYEAVMGGKHYPISTEMPAPTGLAPKFQAVYREYLAQGGSPMAAYNKALGEQDIETKGASQEQRMLDAIAARGGQRDEHDARYRLTVDDQKQREQSREANGRAIARIKAMANSPGMDPKAQAFLPKALEMAQNGESDSAIAAAGAAEHIDPKVWTGQVNAVDRKANADLRSGEKRAGMEFHSLDNTQHGVTASPQEATKLRDKESKFAVVDQRLTDMIDDVKQNGSRVDLLSPDQIQQRLSKGAAVNAALRPYNGLGGTDASQKLEADITGALGAPGHGWLLGANLNNLLRIQQEARDKHRRDIQIGLRPDGGRPLPAAITHDKGSAGAPDLDATLNWARSLPGARQ